MTSKLYLQAKMTIVSQHLSGNIKHVPRWSESRKYVPLSVGLEWKRTRRNETTLKLEEHSTTFGR